MVRPTIMVSSPHGSPMILVLVSMQQALILSRTIAMTGLAV